MFIKNINLLYFVYELKFFRPLINNDVLNVHPVLILWAGALFMYDVLVRRFWNQIPLWKVLLLFLGVCALKE